MLLIFVCYSPSYIFVNRNTDYIFEKLHIRSSRQYLWNRLVNTYKTTHFQGQTSPRAGKPPILPIFMCYSPTFLLVIWNYEFIFSKNLHRHPLRPYLIDSFGLHGKIVPFSMSNEPEQINSYFADFHVLYQSTIFIGHLYSEFIMQRIYTDVC